MPRIWMTLCVGVALWGCSQDVADSVEPAASAPESPALTVSNLADDFVEFWDNSQDLPLEERRELFKRQIGSQFADFYGAQRYTNATRSPEDAQALVDSEIERAIQTFPDIRERYIEKVNGLGANLAAHTQSFAERFPDLDIKHEIYFLHSLGEMDGGTRDFNGRHYLVFGADGMVEYHDFPDYRDEGAFFHHELFHVYHRQIFDDCKDIWCHVWVEGLATYVAATLHPNATESELLLNLPTEMADHVRQNLRANLQDLKARILNPGEHDYQSLLTMDGHGDLPARRGYYLGYLIAQEIGRTHTLRDLARLSVPQVEPLFKQSLDRLIDQAQTP